MSPPDFDVPVVGAGLSGIAVAHHLSRSGRSFAMLEGRQQLVGAWDLFRDPGIRSDSEMPTLGFHP